MKIYHIAAHEKYAKVFVIQVYPGYQRIFLITKVNLPVCTDPGKPVVHPDAEPAKFSLDMVFLAYMRKVEIADIVVLIETNEKFTVSNRYVSWHVCYIP
jgi:hypothetical protein